MKKRFALLLALVVVFAVAIQWLRQESKSTNPVTEQLRAIKIGVSPYQDTLLPIVGLSKGWYKDEGLDVEFVYFDYADIPAAISAGTIDIGVNNCSLTIGNHGRVPNLVYAYAVNPFDGGFALIARDASDVKPIGEFLSASTTREDAIVQCAKQLAGKTIITTSKTDMEQAVAAFALRAGLDIAKDLKIIDLPPDDGLAAFLGGEGDCYMGGIPQRTRAVKEGHREVITGVDLGPAPLNGFVTTKEFVQSRKSDLLSVIHVWFRITQFIDKDMENGAPIVIDELNRRTGAEFTLDDFRRTWNGLETFMLTPEQAQQEILSVDGKNYWRKRWDDCNRYFSEVARTIDRPVPAEGVFLMEEIQLDYLRKYGKEKTKLE